MISLFRPLLRAAMRQGLCEALNRHQKDPSKRDIALIGSRRSGSTLLMQIIATAPAIKSIDQPFSIYSADAPMMRFLPWPAGGMFIDPDPQEKEKLKTYVRLLSEGELRGREPWRVWKSDFHFKTNRVLFKTTDAHYLTGLLEEFGMDVVIYFRHPIPQSLSAARNGWGDKIAHFHAHHVLRTRFLNDTQNELLERINSCGSKLERFILCWCLENLPLFARAAAGEPSVFFEELVTNPQSVIAQISKQCNFPNLKKMLYAAKAESYSVKGLSDNLSIAAIKSRNTDNILKNWLTQVSIEEIDSIQSILAIFPGCPYIANSPSPQPLPGRATEYRSH